MNPTIRLHNTLTRTKEPLRTERPDRVTMYVCGPTVYNYAHIGIARPAAVFDMLSRLLRHDYREVVYALLRLGRCHPLHPGGYDPVPPSRSGERGGGC